MGSNTARTEEWFAERLRAFGLCSRTLACLAHAAGCLKELMNDWGRLSPTCSSALFVAAVVHYAKPFGNNKSAFGKGKWKFPDKKLRHFLGFDSVVHEELIYIRNSLVAHSDTNEFPGSFCTMVSNLEDEAAGTKTKDLMAILTRSPSFAGVADLALARKISAHVSHVCEAIEGEARAVIAEIHGAARADLKTFTLVLSRGEGVSRQTQSDKVPLNGGAIRIETPLNPLPLPALKLDRYGYLYREQRMQYRSVGSLQAPSASSIKINENSDAYELSNYFVT